MQRQMSSGAQTIKKDPIKKVNVLSPPTGVNSGGTQGQDISFTIESSRLSDNESIMSVRSYLDRTDQLNGNYQDYSKIEKLRNFEPAVLNQNLTGFVGVINATDTYWGDQPSKAEEPKVIMQISHVAKVDRFIITEQEYKAAKTI